MNLQASYKLRATATKMRTLRVQRAIKLCERIKTRQETTVPRSSINSGRSRASIGVKLLSCSCFLFSVSATFGVSRCQVRVIGSGSGFGFFAGEPPPSYWCLCLNPFGKHANHFLHEIVWNVIGTRVSAVPLISTIGEHTPAQCAAPAQIRSAVWP